MEEHVLVPVDGSPLAYDALRHALEKFQDATITVLHVIDVFEPTDGGSLYEPMMGSQEWEAMERDAAEAVLSEAETIAADYDRHIETTSEIGDPQRLIPDFARDEGVDHVVIGVHGRDEADRTMFGRVADTVVYRSPVSVTVIR